MPAAIGIDFGASSAKVAVCQGSSVRLLDNFDSSLLTPSAVYLSPGGERLVGEPALELGKRDPANCATSFKHLLGLVYSDPLAQTILRSLPCKVVEDAWGECEFLLRDQRFSPLQLAAAVLEHLRSIAEGDLGGLSGAVLAVPGWFGLRQRRALQQAAELAGLKVLQMLPEATAVALSHNLERDSLSEPKCCLVLNWGGGSFCADVLLCGAGIFQPLGSAGDPRLGGDLLDQHIVEWALQQVRDQQHVDLRELPDAPILLARMKMEAERIKQRLSSTRQPVRMLLPALALDGERQIDIDLELSPGTFESLIRAEVERALELAGSALRQAGLGHSELDLVILAGGSARIPLVKQRMSESFGGKLLVTAGNPLHWVAQGAAMMAAQLAQGEISATGLGLIGESSSEYLMNTLPKAVGVQAGARSEGDNFSVLIPAGTLLPTSKTARHTFHTGQEGQPHFILPLFEEASLETGRKELLGQVQAELPPGLPAGTEVVLELGLDAQGQILASVELPARPQVSIRAHFLWKESAALAEPSQGKPVGGEVLKWSSAPEPKAAAAPANSGGEAETISPAEQLRQELEVQLFQCRLVLDEGRDLIPDDERKALAGLQGELQNLLHKKQWEGARQVSARLAHDLEKYGLLAALGFARAFSQNDQVAAGGNRNLAEELRQEVRIADSSLHNQDMQGAANAVQAATDLAMRLLQGGADLSGSLLFQGGGGGGRRREEPMSLIGPEQMHSSPGLGHAAVHAAPEMEPKPTPRPEVPGALDRVHFSVSGPPVVQPASSFVVDVWAHLDQQRQEVITRAREAALGKPVQIKTKGPLPLRRGTVLTVNLKIDGCQIDDPEDTLLWEGEIGSASFAVRVPGEAQAGGHAGLVTIYANAGQVARINFELAVGNGVSEPAPLPTREKIHRSAFASYASADRDLVLRYIHGMEKAAPFMDIFMDVHSLRSGQNWEQQLWERIPSSDVFFLFWSRNASQSKWVEKEWRCALESKGLEFIDPVPMEPPDLVPPPVELAGLHFNDWELAFQRQSGNRPEVSP